MRLKKINIFSFFLMVWSLSFPSWSVDCEHWQDFERKNKKTGISLVEHISNLSAIHVSDSLSTKSNKKNALAYFFSTGGKYGFRETPIQGWESQILVKALGVATLLAQELDGKTLNLVETRRGYGLRTESTVIQQHLISAQAIVSYTFFMNCYLQMSETDKALLKKSSQALPEEMSLWTEEDFFKPLSQLSLKEEKNSLKSHYLNIPSSTINFLSQIFNFRNFQEQELQLFKFLINKALTERPIKTSSFSSSAQKKIKEVKLQNGARVWRTSDKLISTNLFGGEITGKSINFNGFFLDSAWTDDQLLEVVKSLGIVNVLYS